MTHYIKVIAVIVFVLIIAGCIEERDEYFLNADGSGKVIHEITFVPFGPTIEGEPLEANIQLMNSVKGIFRKSSGIDAWKDVSYKVTNDGHIFFKGTAFFPSLNKLKIYNGIESNAKFNFGTDETGNVFIEFDIEEDGRHGTDIKVDTDVAVLSEAELAEKIKQIRLEYNKSMPIMQSFFSNFKSEAIFHLPSEIEKFSNFEKIDDRTVKITIDGLKILEDMDEKIQDDDWLKEKIIAGKATTNEPQDSFMTNEIIFGEDTPVRTFFAPGIRQLFDYKVEVAIAKQEFKNQFDGLMKMEASTVPIISGAIESSSKTIVAGCRLIKYIDKERGLVPFNSFDGEGYTLSLVVELPSAATKLKKGKIETAVTDIGKSILPVKEWDRKLNFLKLATDKRAVIFDVKLPLPDEGTKGLKELSGTLEYFTSDSFKKVDLGIEEFKAGGSGKEYGAIIIAIEKDSWQEDSTLLRLNLEVPVSAVKDFEFYDSEGILLNVSKRMTMSLNSNSTGETAVYEFAIDGEFPSRGRVILNVSEGLQEHTVNFKITNISLVGTPIKQ